MSSFVPNILLVDDYDLNLDLLEAYLCHGEIHSNIYKASTGLEAIDIVNSCHIDLVLLDVMLPDVDGYVVCNHIKTVLNYTTLPVVMITALNDKESLIKGLAAGADDFLTKPVHRHELMIRVKNLLKLRQVTSELNQQYQQLRDDLAIAKSLQTSFLPAYIPNFNGIDIEIVYNPSIEIGGDFYDVLVVDDDTVGVFIADVKGHGVASAMITAILKDNLTKCKSFWSNPQELFINLNQRLYDFFTATGSDYFVTAFYVLIHLNQGKLIYSNAGHPAAIALLNHQLDFLDTETGFPLGTFDFSQYQNATREFLYEDQLFLFTDGLYELSLFDQIRENDSLKNFILDQGASNIANQLQRLKEEIQNKINATSLIDDVNYISIKNNDKTIRRTKEV